jgi:hypothetical protein
MNNMKFLPLVFVALGWLLPVRAVELTEPTGEAYANMQRDPLLVAYVHPYRVKQGREFRVADSGALGGNALFEAGQAKARFIEEQRRGTDYYLAPGLILGDDAAQAIGLRALEYGFAWETEQGEFPGNPDPFHSATFFLEGAAHGLLLMRQFDTVAYEVRMKAWRPKLTALALWLMRPENVESAKAVKDLKRFSHRYYSYAAALGLAGELLDLPEASAAAARHAEGGILVQRADGVNPERDGFDAGYQAAGLQFATRYWFFCDNADLRARLAGMIERATDVLVSHLDEQGKMSVEGSTRIGKEKTRDGVTKNFHHAVLVNVLVHAAAITGRDDYLVLARKVGENQVRAELVAASPAPPVAINKVTAPDLFGRYYSVQREPLMISAVYKFREMAARRMSTSPTGAVAANVQWERGEKKNRYIEEQRFGADMFLQPGIMLKDDALIQKGIEIMEWGFAWQQADGTFPGSPDEFHSASFFLDAASRMALLMLAEDPVRYGARVEAWKPKIRALCAWLLRPDVSGAEKPQKDFVRFTHRNYLLAAGLAQAGVLLNIPEAMEEAKVHARRGMLLQEASGVNPEKGGLDVSYQDVGLMFAAQYYYVCGDEAMRKEMAAMMIKSLTPLLSRTDAEGAVSIADSTRMGKEMTREGRPKRFNPSLYVHVLLMSAEITGDDYYRAVAETVAQKQVIPLLAAQADR